MKLERQSSDKNKRQNTTIRTNKSFSSRALQSRLRALGFFVALKCVLAHVIVIDPLDDKPTEVRDCASFGVYCSAWCLNRRS